MNNTEENVDIISKLDKFEVEIDNQLSNIKEEYIFTNKLDPENYIINNNNINPFEINCYKNKVESNNLKQFLVYKLIDSNINTEIYFIEKKTNIEKLYKEIKKREIINKLCILTNKIIYLNEPFDLKLKHIAMICNIYISIIHMLNNMIEIITENVYNIFSLLLNYITHILNENVDYMEYLEILIMYINLFVVLSKDNIPYILLRKIIGLMDFKLEKLIMIYNYIDIKEITTKRNGASSIRKNSLEILLRLFTFKKHYYKDNIDIKREILNKCLNILENDCFITESQGINLYYTFLLYIFIRDEIGEIPLGGSIFNHNIIYIQYKTDNSLARDLTHHYEIVRGLLKNINPLEYQMNLENYNQCTLNIEQSEIIIHNTKFIYIKLIDYIRRWYKYAHGVDNIIRENIDYPTKCDIINGILSDDLINLCKYILLLIDVLDKYQEKNIFKYKELNLKNTIELIALINIPIKSILLDIYLKELTEYSLKKIWKEYNQN
jgi:hypothetical protein